MEWNLDHNLTWIACRHHVFEVMLSTIFTTAFGTSEDLKLDFITVFRNNGK